MPRRLLAQTILFAGGTTIACACAAWGASPEQRTELALFWFFGVFGAAMWTRKLARALAPPDQWLAIGPLLIGAVTSMSVLHLLR